MGFKERIPKERFLSGSQTRIAFMDIYIGKIAPKVNIPCYRWSWNYINKNKSNKNSNQCRWWPDCYPCLLIPLTTSRSNYLPLPSKLEHTVWNCCISWLQILWQTKLLLAELNSVKPANNHFVVTDVSGLFCFVINSSKQGWHFRGV